jgi:hypothetical protein
MRRGIALFSLILPLQVVGLSPSFSQTREICTISDDVLVSRFYSSLGLSANEPIKATRWPSQIFSVGFDAASPLSRETRTAVFNAFGKLGVLGSQFHFQMDFTGKQTDITLRFMPNSLIRRIFQNMPPDAVVSSSADACKVRIYISPSGSNELITKANILVDEDLAVLDLPVCVANALVRSIGLIHWSAEKDQRRSDFDRYSEARIFLTVLYGDGVVTNSTRQQLVFARDAACRGESR